MSDVIHGLDSVPAALRGCALTIGNFDGVHLGHQQILLMCRSLAHTDRRPVVAMTFDPLPEVLLRPREEAPPLILPPAKRYDVLLKSGADFVVTMPATAELLSLPARTFVDEIIMQHFAPLHVVEGADFFFGRSRGGNVVTLENMGIARAFSVSVVQSVVLMLSEGQRRVSSTLIRELVRDGRVEDAAACLGRPFALYGTVVPGQQKGRTLGFPTINLATSDQVVPSDGVYAGRATMGNASYLAAVSIGNKVTFGPVERTIEAYLLDASGDFYGLAVELSLLRRLRPQQKFDSPEALMAQIAQDVAAVRELGQP